MSQTSCRALFGRTAVFALLFLATGTCADPSPNPTRPNIILVVVDDLGWMDTGVYGSSVYETPNIDQFAREGIRFNSFYTSSPVCSPTRASIMTGKHPARLRITNWIGGEQEGALLPAEYHRHLAAEEVTVGEALAQEGYTTGYIGKWHLGGPPFMPANQGFQHTIAVNHAGQPGSYFYPYQNESWPATNVPDLEDGDVGDYLTDRLTSEAVSFLEENRDTTFFLILSHYAVHTPLQAPAPLEALDAARINEQPSDGPSFAPEHNGRGFTKLVQDNPTYAAMVRSTDRSLGRILAALKDLDLDEETAVLFVSDNGGLSTLATQNPNTPTSNRPLRAGKGWLYEGGIRAPLLARWPGHILGGAVSSALATTDDLFPTILALSGAPLRPELHRDGFNLVPLMVDGAESDRRTAYWHFPHYHGSGSHPSSAIRDGHLKLILWAEDQTAELFDVLEDPEETTDLSRDRPHEVERLRLELTNWLAEVDAATTRTNPDWVAPVR